MRSSVLTSVEVHIIESTEEITGSVLVASLPLRHTVPIKFIALMNAGLLTRLRRGMQREPS